MSSATQLKKELGASQFFSLGFGTIIGVGWVIVLGEWLGQAGPLGAALGFLGGGLLMLLVGSCYAELSTMMPASGAEVAYAYEIFGLKPCFIIGWLLALVWISVTTFEAISVGWIAAALLPGIEGPDLYVSQGSPVRLGSLLLGLAGMLLLTALNYRGAKTAARFQEILTYTLIAFSFLFITTGLGWGQASNLEPLFSKDSSGSIWPGVLAVCVTAPFWFGGFNVIPQVMEEKAPGISKALAARTILLSISLAGVFYVLVILSSSMTMPWQNLLNMELPAAAAFQAAFNSSAMAKLVLTAALLGLLTSWNAVFIAGTRVLFALGRARIIPSPFRDLHPSFGTPRKAVLFVGFVGALGVFLGRGAIIPIVNVCATCFVLAYLLTCLGVIKRRLTHASEERPFRVPGGIATAGVAVLGCLCMIAISLYQPYMGAEGSLPLEWIYLIIWLILGGIFWVVTRRIRLSVTEEERRRLILGGIDQ